MKKSRSFLAVLIVSLSYVLSPVTAKAALWDVPVAPGETFRWVFVTSLTIDAYSPDIATYNTLVNQAADVATPISGVLGKDSIDEIEWRAIASTPYTDAFDNIGVSSAPIFTPLGVKVAEDRVDMFDGTLLYPIHTTEWGGTLSGLVWTGTGPDGLGAPHDELGSLGGLSAFGDIGYTNGYWAEWGRTSAIYIPQPLYAISEELTVVPEPGALILAATGMFSATLGFMRLRRKHQE